LRIILQVLFQRVSTIIKESALARRSHYWEQNTMRTRFWMITCLCFGLLVPAASANQRKPHPAGKHPKPNHPMSKYKAKKPKKIKH